MVVGLDLCGLLIDCLDLIWLQPPAHACDCGDELVVVALCSPLLDPLFVCSTIKHEGVHRPRNCTTFPRLGLIPSVLIWSVCPRHHILNRYVIILSQDTQRLRNSILRVFVFGLSCSLRAWRWRHSATRTAACQWCSERATTSRQYARPSNWLRRCTISIFWVVGLRFCQL